MSLWLTHVSSFSALNNNSRGFDPWTLNFAYFKRFKSIYFILLKYQTLEVWVPIRSFLSWGAFNKSEKYTYFSCFSINLSTYLMGFAKDFSAYAAQFMLQKQFWKVCVQTYILPKSRDKCQNKITTVFGTFQLFKCRELTQRYASYSQIKLTPWDLCVVC